MDEPTQGTENVAAEAAAAADETAHDREALAAETQARLDAVFGDEPDDEDTETDVETEEETEVEIEEDESASDDASDEHDDGEAEETAADDSAPTLPDAHRRSLKAYGWQDDDIEKNLKVLGDDFLRTAERLHENRNAEVAGWAARGRATREQQATETGQGGQEAQSGDLTALDPIDAKALKEKYGDDEMVDAIVDPVNQAIAAINGMLPRVQQTQAAAQQSEIEAMGREVDSFFGDDTMGGYVDLYGRNDTQVSEEQFGKRVEVLDTAYNLRVGAAQVHGREMGLREALELAHEIVAKDFHAAAATKRVVREAKTRNKGIIQRPTNRGKGSVDISAPKTRAELEAATTKRLAEVFS